MSTATKAGTEPATWAEYALDSLSEAGYRRGGSRRRVVELLGNQSCAVTALEMDDQLKGVGRATVYRALEQMEELGLIQKIDVGGDSAGYEKVDPQGHHHHHIVCTGCGKVVPFEDKKLEQVIHEVSERDGFSIQSHDITLKGTCEDC
ncbi:MAG: transcriptional repressor [Solirubrobacterales bacterium]|nr:transcriptional repressor [Solirubrobacterales bacterium]